jgi:hypothetical protein
VMSRIFKLYRKIVNDLNHVGTSTSGNERAILLQTLHPRDDPQDK